MFRRKKREKEREDMAAWMQQGIKELKSEVQRLNVYNEELVCENRNLSGQLEETGRVDKALRKLLVDVISDDADYEALYQSLEDVLDPGGYRLYDEAKKRTRIDVCSFFPTEDNLGYFENLDGHGLLLWLVKAKFGEIEWEPLNPPYERAGSVSFGGQEENISEFYRELYKKTVQTLLS